MKETNPKGQFSALPVETFSYVLQDDLLQEGKESKTLSAAIFLRFEGLQIRSDYGIFNFPNDVEDDPRLASQIERHDTHKGGAPGGLFRGLRKNCLYDRGLSLRISRVSNIFENLRIPITVHTVGLSRISTPVEHGPFRKRPSSKNILVDTFPVS